jgi:hypothetical protein
MLRDIENLSIRLNPRRWESIAGEQLYLTGEA